jgi:hypothetical protein
MERKPSRELDTLVAETVMGWKDSMIHEGEWCALDPVDPSVFQPPPPYSTDIAAAWTVVEKLSQVNFLIQTRTFNNQPHQSMCLILKDVDADVWITAVGEHMPHAICLAALKACESR